jgi:hypothetical protein
LTAPPTASNPAAVRQAQSVYSPPQAKRPDSFAPPARPLSSVSLRPGFRKIHHFFALPAAFTTTSEGAGLLCPHPQIFKRRQSRRSGQSGPSPSLYRPTTNTTVFGHPYSVPQKTPFLRQNPLPLYTGSPNLPCLSSELR